METVDSNRRTRWLARTNADVHALTGAYVLDALSDEERLQFERHLDRCGTCMDEVAELRETATRLALRAAEAPPSDLRVSVLDRVAEVRQQPPVVEWPPTRRRPPVAQRLLAVAASILLVIAATLGVLLVRAHQSAENTREQADAVTAVLRAEDATIVSQRDTGSGRLTVVSSAALDRAVVIADGMAQPPPGHDYQAWTRGAHVRSAGLVEPHDGDASLVIGGVRDADQIRITIERDGGSREPTGEPVMLVDLP